MRRVCFMAVDGPRRGELFRGILHGDKVAVRLRAGEVSHSAVAGVVTYHLNQVGVQTEWSGELYFVATCTRMSAAEAAVVARTLLSAPTTAAMEFQP